MNTSNQSGGLWQRIRRQLKSASLWQFVKFGIVGISNTLLSLATYQLCLHALGLHYQFSNVLAFIVSVTNSYYWNSRYVFKLGHQKGIATHLRSYGRAFLSYGSTFLLSTALLALWVEGCGISKTLAPILNLLITVPLNFILNKFWAFRNASTKEDAQ